MSEGDPDNVFLRSLTAQKRQVLEHFQEICGTMDIKQQYGLLERHNWNLEAAIDEHLAQNSDEIIREVATPSASITPSVLNDSPHLRSDYASHIPSSRVTTAYSLLRDGVNARRMPISPRSLPPVVLNPPYLQILHSYQRLTTWEWAKYIILAPFQVAYCAFRDIFHLLFSLFWYRNRRPQITHPIADVRNFSAYFREKFCIPSQSLATNHFCQQTYAEALSCAKEEFKFLMVYLHSDGDSSSDAFSRDVLCHPLFLRLVADSSRILFWACNRQSGEGKRVCQALQCQTFPFLGVIVLRENRTTGGRGKQMCMIVRVEGYDPLDAVTRGRDVVVSELLNRLNVIFAENEIDIVQAKAAHIERIQTQLLRNEQDREYRESIRQDQLRFDAKVRAQAEESNKVNQQLVQQRLMADAKRIVLDSMPADVLLQVGGTGSVSSSPISEFVIRVCVRMPNGSRVQCSFPRDVSSKYLFLAIFTLKDAPTNMEMFAFPKRHIPCTLECLTPPLSPDLDLQRNFWKPMESDPPSFAELGFSKSETVLVMDKDA